jgi:hypothetical protein
MTGSDQGPSGFRIADEEEKSRDEVDDTLDADTRCCCTLLAADFNTPSNRILPLYRVDAMTIKVVTRGLWGEEGSEECD